MFSASAAALQATAESTALVLLAVDRPRADQADGLLRPRAPRTGQSEAAPDAAAAALRGEPTQDGRVPFVLLRPWPAGPVSGGPVTLGSFLPAGILPELEKLIAPDAPPQVYVLTQLDDFSGAPPDGPCELFVPPPDGRPPLGLTFSTEVGLVISQVRRENASDFEQVLQKLKEALAKSQAPCRRQQAVGWKVFRASRTPDDGVSRYVFLIDPVVPGADYSVSKILGEGLPDESGTLYTRMREALLPGGVRVALRPLAPR